MALSMLLRMAVLAGVQEAVRLRVRIGDDVNAVDAKGRTPLILAASKGHAEICTLLLESGADPHVADAAGETALAAADRHGHAELTVLLRESLAASSEPRTDGTSHVSVIPEPADHGPRVHAAPLHVDAEASPILNIDIPAVADEDLPPPTLTNRLLSIGPGILSAPAIAVDQAPAPSSLMGNALNTPDLSGFARPVLPIADDLADRIPDDDEPFDLSVWEADEDQTLPEHDAQCAALASALRHRIATHTPVDTDADWTDIDISLPDPEPIRRRRAVIDDDRLEAVRHLLIEGLRDGFVTHWRIDAVAVDASGEPDDEFALKLKLALIESGILIDEDAPEFQASGTEEAGEDEEDVVMDAFAFMRNLASRHNDPASLYCPGSVPERRSADARGRGRHRTDDRCRTGCRDCGYCPIAARHRADSANR